LVALPLAASAQTFTYTANVVPETQLLNNSKADFDASGLAVSPSGTIYSIDIEGTDSILRTIGGTTTTMALETDLFNALDAVNGTSPVTTVSARQIAVAADGSVIVLAFAVGANQDVVFSLTDAAPATITVVYGVTDGNTSLIDGSGSIAMIGNTAYIGTDTTNGTTNSVWSLDTNAAFPATVTEVITQAELAALDGAVAAADLALNALTSNGTFIYGTMSATTPAPDHIVRIDPTSGGSATILVNGPSILAAATAFDVSNTAVGYGSIAVDAAGRLWLPNRFGTGNLDEGMIVISNPGLGSQTISFSTGASLIAGVGSGATSNILANDGIIWDASGSRLLMHVVADGTGEGVASVTSNANVENWASHD
jgi:hypothetical protein